MSTSNVLAVTYSRAVTPAIHGFFTDIIAVVDFNGDGRQDVLVGGDGRLYASCLPPAQRPVPAPFRIMLSNGDGTLRDGTAEVLRRTPGDTVNFAQPHGVVADFNNDGRPDVAVFDFGAYCELSAAEHTFIGYAPVLLLSTPDGKWQTSNVLADAITRTHAARYPRFSGPYTRARQVTAGDINGDGRIDIFVEAAGGENLDSHFLMNNADGSFTADVDRAPRQALHNPPPEFWRHWGNALADLNGDGSLDLILGQTRDTDPTHINAASVVIYNDGSGRFPLSNRALLPPPNFNGGFTQSLAVAVLDLDGDGLQDLILAHTRNDYISRYLQVLMNRGPGRFVDDTVVRIGDQSLTTPLLNVRGEPLRNKIDHVFLRDVDNDGTLDLVFNSRPPASIRPEAPLVHLNNGRGQFAAMDANIFTGGEGSFGENSVPLDLNGDGVLDFLHPDAVPGADGTYGTADDTTQLIALVGAGAPCVAAVPTLGPAQISGSTVTLSWSAAQTPLGFVLEAGSGPGLANIVVFDTRSAATTFMAREVPRGIYYVRVRARTACGTSGPSNEVIVTVP
jgi:hypothetical protein